jgi:hypothetical protein
MWTCPNCKRKFKNTHQDHSCAVTDIEVHFMRLESEAEVNEVLVTWLREAYRVSW